MKFIAFGDIVENKDALNKLSKLKLSTYDFAIFTGDVLSMEVFKRLREERVLKREIYGTAEERKKHLKEDVEKLELLNREVEKLKDINKVFRRISSMIPLYGVWGNADHAYIMSKVLFGDNFKNIHLSPLKIGNVFFIGYEGRPKYIFEKDYDNPTEHAFEEEKAYTELQKLLIKLNPTRWVFITHVPPYGILDQVKPQYRKYAVGTYGEKAKHGNIGSNAFLKIVEEFHPTLHVFGHIHESKGKKTVGETTFVNIGSFGKDRSFIEVKIDTELEISFNKI
jgi:Icc-related predicted phosphoesterase